MTRGARDGVVVGPRGVGNGAGDVVAIGAIIGVDDRGAGRVVRRVVPDVRGQVGVTDLVAVEIGAVDGHVTAASIGRDLLDSVQIGGDDNGPGRDAAQGDSGGSGGGVAVVGAPGGGGIGLAVADSRISYELADLHEIVVRHRGGGAVRPEIGGRPELGQSHDWAEGKKHHQQESPLGLPLLR